MEIASPRVMVDSRITVRTGVVDGAHLRRESFTSDHTMRHTREDFLAQGRVYCSRLAAHDPWTTVDAWLALCSSTISAGPETPASLHAANRVNTGLTPEVSASSVFERRLQAIQHSFLTARFTTC